MEHAYLIPPSGDSALCAALQPILEDNAYKLEVVLADPVGESGMDVVGNMRQVVETFIVRTILDPALAALFGRWTWWPGGIPNPTVASRQMPTPESRLQV